MKMRTKQLFVVLSIVLLIGLLYTGSVFAQTTTPTTPTTMLQWMQERLGPEAWAQRVEWMTQRHGTEFVSQMMNRMAQQTFTPGANGERGPGMGMRQGMMGQGRMGQGMMQQQPNGAPQSMMGRGMMRQGMMGQGMMGQGAQAQGRPWGFHHPMGQNFWQNTPTTPPTAPQ